jgi:hypothetical protein
MPTLANVNRYLENRSIVSSSQIKKKKGKSSISFLCCTHKGNLTWVMLIQAVRGVGGGAVRADS